jgi:phage/plasmid-like protein (TIGR03299 family)
MSEVAVRNPSWYQKEKAVLKLNPMTWEDAVKEAGIDWEVTSEPIYTQGFDAAGDEQFYPVHGQQAICRDDRLFRDPSRVLGVQKSSYAAIQNKQFGEVIETVLGINEDYLLDDNGEELVSDPVEFEALAALHGGRQILALMKFTVPLEMPWDPSKTFRYLVVASRHDGQGGLRGITSNLRQLCANAFNPAAIRDGRAAGFTIKHTVNWEGRVEEVKRNLAASRDDSKKWLDFTEKLATWKASDYYRDKYLKQLMPLSEDMSPRKVDNVNGARQDIRKILVGKTCENISDTGYGLLMATTEWSDHYRAYQNVDSYVSRQLLNKEPLKARAARILMHMAKA